MGIDTISLHDAAVDLGKLRTPNEKLAPDRLLSLLKSGIIQTGIVFHYSCDLWIPIPASFWATISSDNFAIIRRTPKVQGSGAYKLYLAEVSDELANQLNKIGRSASEDWKEILRASAKQYEVVIERNLWSKYLSGQQTQTLSSERKPKGGRHQKKAWRNLAIVIAAYIIKHYETEVKRIKPEAEVREIKSGEAGQNIHELAKKLQIQDLPASPTISGEISKIFQCAEAMDFVKRDFSVDYIFPV